MLRAAFFALLGCWMMQASAIHAAPVAVATDGNAWALLIGVSEYPALSSARQLRGPRQDVEVIRSTLRAARSQWADITVLADGVSDARALPTRNAIFEAFERLERRVGPRDFVVVYLAGHGSQQPALDPREPDGLDEIFLPRDIGSWDGRAGTVRNAITDNEIDLLLSRLLAKGAQVWAIFDTCHSGTLNRGGALLADREIARWVRPAELGIRAVGSAARAPDESQDSVLSPERPGLVVFSAAQASQTTQELRLPPGDPARVYRGLFTYALTESLAGAGSPTYRQLAQSIRTRYAAMNRISPTPLFDGELGNFLPLNTAALARATGVRVETARVHGPRACDPKIVAAPCDGAAATAADLSLRDRVERALRAAGAAAATRWENVTDAEIADVSIVVRDGRVWFLSPVDDYAADGRQAPNFAPAALGDEALAQRIAQYIEPIATARWLYRLGEGTPPALNLEVSARHCEGAGGEILDLSGQPRKLAAGTALCVAVENGGSVPIDVTVLHLGEDYSIAAIFPLNSESNRLAAGQRRTLRLDVVAVGAPALDRLMFLAVATTPDAAPTDFSWAAQAGVPPAVLRGGTTTPGRVWIHTLRWIAVPVSDT